MKKYQKLIEYAKEHNVPIIESEGLDYLLAIISQTKPTHILEIGTAIGYSALNMYDICQSQITTFERNPQMIKQARINFEYYGVQNKIKLISEDFLKYNPDNLPKFDFVYIDGAKAQYYKFFKHIENNLSQNAVVIFDNLTFHDFVYNEEKKKKVSRNLKQLLRKLENSIECLKKEENYDFKIIKVGDGLGILKRREDARLNHIYK